MTRDELARRIYVTEPLGPDVRLTHAEQDAGAEGWDAGDVKDEDRADCYRRADQMIAAGTVEVTA